MSVFSHVDGLGQCLEELIADCVLSWRDEFGKRHQLVDVIAQEIQEVSTTLNLRPQGIAIVTVTVEGKKYSEQQCNCFRLKRRGSGTWFPSASSLPEV